METQWVPGQSKSWSSPPSSTVLFALDVHSIGVSEYGHHTTRGQDSLFSGGTNKAFFFYFGKEEVW